MKIQWALLAEGAIVDARGALAAVGLAQSVLIAPVLPMGARRAIILLLSGPSNEFVPGRPVKFSFHVVPPSGGALFEHKGSIPMASNNFPELPTGVNISAEAAFTIKEYGRHVINVSVEPSGHSEMNVELEFYVMKPPGESGTAPRNPESTGVA